MWFDLTELLQTWKDMELSATLSWSQLSENAPEVDGLECISTLNFVSGIVRNCSLCVDLQNGPDNNLNQQKETPEMPFEEIASN